MLFVVCCLLFVVCCLLFVVVGVGVGVGVGVAVAVAVVVVAAAAAITAVVGGGDDEVLCAGLFNIPLLFTMVNICVQFFKVPLTA